MTGFSGYLLRGDSDRWRQRKNGLAETCRTVLSRNPADKIEAHLDPSGGVWWYNNGAWGVSGLVQRGSCIGLVAGHPHWRDTNASAEEYTTSCGRVVDALLEQKHSSLEGATGAFCSVALDFGQKRVHFAADKLSIRPLYIYLDDGICIFATSMRVMRKLIGDDQEVDEQGLAEKIFFGQSLSSRTLYKSVRVLRPGQILTIRDTSVSQSVYHCYSKLEPLELSEPELSRRLYQAFIDAVRRRSYRGCEDAFLSGGLDSRCVVAGLLDLDRKVRTFSSSYANTADEVISRLVAEEFRTDHFEHERLPGERLLLEVDSFALYASKNFPKDSRAVPGGRVIWSGDGGSVGMGHVYLTESSVKKAAVPLTPENMRELFPALGQRKTRLAQPSMVGKLRGLALEGAKAEFEYLAGSRPDRRLFLFFMYSDQTRHLWNHFEDIDLSSVEFETPFFDSDFLTIVTRSPIGPFLYHRLYNHWLREFRTPAASLPWQSYPGHEPCPYPLPPNVRIQWSKSWYQGREARQAVAARTRRLSKNVSPLFWRYISYQRVQAFLALNAIGIGRYDYELTLACNIGEAFGSV